MLSSLVAGIWEILRGFRRFFARENLGMNLRQLATVIPLTVLVWIYAEQQQLVSEKDIPVKISLTSTDPAKRMVSLVTPSDGTLQVTLRGSQTGIDHVKTLLEESFTKPLEISVDSSVLPGPSQNMQILNAISAQKPFHDYGVEVIASLPESLVVRVDELEDLAAPVVAQPDVPGLVKIVFNPPTVTMRGPLQTLHELARQDRLAAVVDITGEPTLKQPGEHKNISLHLLPQPNITFIPDTVTADLIVGQADESLSISLVPVKVEASKWLIDNYKFDYKEILAQPVTLSGPPTQMALIDPRNPKLIAVVDLENTDAGFHGQKLVTFQNRGLPDGVRVKPDATAVTVQINVDPR